METRVTSILGGSIAIVLTIAVAPRMFAQPVSLSPGAMPLIGTVDEPFQSYNYARSMKPPPNYSTYQPVSGFPRSATNSTWLSSPA